MKIILKITLLITAFIFQLFFLKPALADANGKENCSCGSKSFHSGVDWTAKQGAPIPAAADGKVVKIEQNEKAIVYVKDGGYCGRYVVLLHTASNGRRVYTRYGQLGNIVNKDAKPLKLGDVLMKNDKIGEVGKSGFYHFELRPADGAKGNNAEWSKLYSKDSSMNWAAYSVADPSKFDFKEYSSP